MLIPIDKLDTAFKLVCNDAKGNKQVIIFSSTDVDSICATKVLTDLFRTESVQYTIKTVSCYEDILQALQFVNDEFCAVFLINCGASADITANFHIDSEAIFYVCDSHLPFHPANVEDQERILLFNSTIENQDDSGKSSDSSSSSSASEDESVRKKDTSTTGSYFGISAAKMMYTMAYQLRKSTIENLWLAIVGMTDQFIHGRIDYKQYHNEVRFFKGEVQGFNNDAMELDDGRQDTRIAPEKEYKFPLFRHWNLYESMYYSTYISARLGTWTENGKKSLNTLLVKMGLPLKDCENKWIAISSNIKKALKQNISKAGAEFKLEDATYSSFVKTIAFKTEVSASDIVFAVSSMLESSEQNSFWKALDILSNNIEALEEGLQKAITLQQAVFRVGTTLVKNNTVIRSGGFRYAFLPESADLSLLTKPLALTKLTWFLAEAFTGFLQQKHKPWILLGFDSPKNSYLLTGIMASLPSAKRRNQFGLAYQAAVQQTQSRISSHYFDASVLSIVKEDVKKFIEFMHAGGY